MRCLRDAFACMPAIELRAWRNVFDCQVETDNLSRDLLSECLVFATRSQAVGMSVISLRSTQQIVINWKLKAIESVSAKMTGSSHVNECMLNE